MHIRPFEIALIGIFALMGLIGLFYLANYEPEMTDEQRLYGSKVSIWGTFDAQVMREVFFEITQTNQAFEVVEYTQVDPRTFDNNLINAIAEGRSPDLVIMPHTLLVSYRSKLQPISFETIPMRTLRDTYVDGAEIFALSDGVYGIPFAVDPLVMYWNRDIFSSSGLATPPKTWEALMAQVPSLVRVSDDLSVTRSAVALGEYTNIRNAKDILAMLFLQSGTTMIEEGVDGYRITLGQGSVGGLNPGDAVLNFYTQFAIPNRELYSWNRSKRLDRTEFLNGTLALYFGKGSEVNSLERENSNLNFDVAPVPQGSGVTAKRNYGDFYAFVIPRAANNMQGAYTVATLLGSPAMAQKLVDGYSLGPVHRALYTGTVQDPFRAVTYESALIARGWLDPSPVLSNDIFRRMVEGVTGGSTRLRSVIMDAVQELESLF